MKIYRISFSGNQPVSCIEMKDAEFEGSHHYVHANGRLLYAIVKVESEIEVPQKCWQLTEEARRKVPVKS